MEPTRASPRAAPTDSALVGRAEELAALEAALSSREPRLVHLTGPAGVGKTALALALAQRFEAAGRTVAWAREDDAAADLCIVDADDGDPEPLARAWLPRLAPTRRVLLVSRGSLPAGCIVDPRLAALVQAHPLTRLAPEHAVELGMRLGLERADAEAIAVRSEGSPLLVAADAARLRASRERARPDTRPGLPLRLRGRELRSALFATALVRHLTEPLLSAMLGQDASHLFDALAIAVPFERGEMGLVLPDSLRDLALDELALRAPELRSEWARRAQDALLDRIDRAPLDEIPPLVADLLFACRFEPYAAGIAERAGSPRSAPDGSEDARQRARAAVARFEGERSAEIFDLWCDTEWATLFEARDPGGEPRGFVLLLALHPDAPHPAGDPLIDALMRAVRVGGAPLAGHERVHVGRFWMDYERFQSVRPAVSAWADLVATGAVVSASVHRDAPVWIAMRDRAFALLAEAPVDGVRYAAFGLDRRRESVAAVFARFVEAARTGTARTDDALYALPSAPTEDTPLALDRDSLGPPLRAALRAYHRADLLGASPLTELRWVRERVASTGSTPGEALAQRLDELVASLGKEGHDGQLGAALRATYLADASKGHAVAADLGMGYSTYRRWLRNALDRAADVLAAREAAARRADGRR